MHACIDLRVEAVRGAEAETAELDTTTTMAAPRSVAALRVMESGNFTGGDLTRLIYDFGLRILHNAR